MRKELEEAEKRARAVQDEHDRVSEEARAVRAELDSSNAQKLCLEQKIAGLEEQRAQLLDQVRQQAHEHELAVSAKDAEARQQLAEKDALLESLERSLGAAKAEGQAQHESIV